jgi:hypothetical protein
LRTSAVSDRRDPRIEVRDVLFRQAILAVRLRGEQRVAHGVRIPETVRNNDEVLSVADVFGPGG